jgi:hypothetical protein
MQTIKHAKVPQAQKATQMAGFNGLTPRKKSAQKGNTASLMLNGLGCAQGP